MVDGSGLENRRTRKGTGGSNPSLSAILSFFCFQQVALCWYSHENQKPRHLRVHVVAQLGWPFPDQLHSAVMRREC